MDQFTENQKILICITFPNCKNNNGGKKKVEFLKTFRPCFKLSVPLLTKYLKWR